MSHGDDSMKKTLLEMLLTELESEIPKMKSLIEEADWKTLRETSHRMKTTLPYVGNQQMLNANLEIENRAKQLRQLEQVPQFQNQLESLYPKVLEELRAEYAKLG